MVPEEGVEPTRPCGQRILSPSRLPFRHSGSSFEIVVAGTIYVKVKSKKLRLKQTRFPTSEPGSLDRTSPATRYSIAHPGLTESRGHVMVEQDFQSSVEMIVPSRLRLPSRERKPRRLTEAGQGRALCSLTARMH